MSGETAHLELSWTLPAILAALREDAVRWALHVPYGEPFEHLLDAPGPGLEVVPSAARGVELAAETGGRVAILVPNRQVPEALQQAMEVREPMVLVLEDHPGIAPRTLPRRTAQEAGLIAVEPADAAEVHECTVAARHLAEARCGPVAMVMHHWLVGSAATVAPDASRGPRLTIDSGEPLRVARRLELNRVRGLPSPGERVPVGFVTVGPSDGALRYLVNKLRLLGRVPTLNLRLVHPVDEAPLHRLLLRCRNVVVLEPRPGEVEHSVLAAAEALRREGEVPGAVWGRVLPPIDVSDEPPQAPVDALHPSVLARMIKHLLHEIRPAAKVADQLHVPGPVMPDGSSARSPAFGTIAAMQWLQETCMRVASDAGIDAMVVDGVPVGTPPEDAPMVAVETWGPDRLRGDGIEMLSGAAREARTRLVLSWARDNRSASLGRVARAVLPAPRDEAQHVLELPIDDVETLKEAMATALTRPGLTLLIAHEGAEPRFDLRAMSAATTDIDVRGFRPRQSLVISMADVCAICPPGEGRSGADGPSMPLETTMQVEHHEAARRRVSFSVEPLLERVEVTRRRAPVRVIAGPGPGGVSPPVLRHAAATTWRLHVAGTRGNTPGAAVAAILEAGRRMDYEVRCRCNTTLIGPGRRAWAQVLFTRRMTARTQRPLVAAVPWGEADLLLGWDPPETLRAIDRRVRLQVAAPGRTVAIANTGLLDAPGQQGNLVDALSEHCVDAAGMVADFAALAAYRFHNERLGDLVQVGVAFQQGLVPVSLDAMLCGVAALDPLGFARSSEAFEFGRKLALMPEAQRVPSVEGDPEPTGRLARRSVLHLRRGGRGAAGRSASASRVFDRLRVGLAGLGETEAGREARRHAVMAARRCLLWGGDRVAERYANLLCSLYACESDPTCPMTRAAALPLAEAMLVRDVVYLGRLARSPEVRRSIRQRLNVRLARGDEISRRFLVRIRASLPTLSLRMDLRTGDWAATLVSTLGVLVPQHWRGSRRDRAVRALVIEAVEQATRAAHDQQPTWAVRLAALDAAARSGQLHEASEREIRRLLS